MTKEELLHLDKEYQEMKKRISQLSSIKFKSSMQKFEIRIMENLKHNKEVELVNAMMTHSSLQDIVELTGHEEIILKEKR